MKHKNAEMIKAVVDNVELVILVKVIDPENELGNYWSASSLATLAAASNDFFLCLPQHKEACLHWLNGGGVQAIHFENQMPDSGVMFDSDFVDVEDGVNTYPWKTNHIFMQEHEIRIKPKKEKRWLSIRRIDLLVDDKPYKTREEAEAANSPAYWNHYELLIEV